VDSGFYAACAGLQAQSQALEVAAHNLANLNTVGFRGQQPTFQTLLAAARPTVPNILNLATNNFGVLEGTHLDMTAGNLETTGNPLDASKAAVFLLFRLPLAPATRATEAFRCQPAGNW
jgi:flagellar hook-basal body protein